jgi:hypothetical protein
MKYKICTGKIIKNEKYLSILKPFVKLNSLQVEGTANLIMAIIKSHRNTINQKSYCNSYKGDLTHINWTTFVRANTKGTPTQTQLAITEFIRNNINEIDMLDEIDKTDDFNNIERYLNLKHLIYKKYNEKWNDDKNGKLIYYISLCNVEIFKTMLYLNEVVTLDIDMAYKLDILDKKYASNENLETKLILKNVDIYFVNKRKNELSIWIEFDDDDITVGTERFWLKQNSAKWLQLNELFYDYKHI